MKKCFDGCGTFTMYFFTIYFVFTTYGVDVGGAFTMFFFTIYCVLTSISLLEVQGTTDSFFKECTGMMRGAGHKR
jgi:hypothetical protein